MPQPRKEEGAPKAEAPKEVVKKEETQAVAEKQDTKTQTTAEEGAKEGANNAELKEALEKITGHEKTIQDLTIANDAGAQQLELTESRVKELEGDLAQKSQIIQKLSQELGAYKDNAEKAKQDLTVDETLNKSFADVAEVSSKKPREVTVKFLKDHEFSIGTRTINAKKKDTYQVDIFVANKLSQRQIATII